MKASRSAWLGLTACALMLAGCGTAGSAAGRPSAQPGCGHPGSGAAGSAAVFFVTSPGASGACAYTYTGERAGRTLTYPRCFEACAEVRPSPDGHDAVTGSTVTDTATTRPVGEIPADAVNYVWAADSRHLCAIRSGPAVPVVLMVAGLDGQPEQVTLAPVFARVRHSGISLVSCDPAHARAVLQATYQRVTAFAVVSLSDGAVLSEHDFPGASGGGLAPGPRTSPGPGAPPGSDVPPVPGMSPGPVISPGSGIPVVTAVVPSPGGRYLAVLHATLPVPSPSAPGPSPAAPSAVPARAPAPGQPVMTSPVASADSAVPVPAYLDVFDIDNPARPVARLPGAQVAAFSGDAALLAERTGSVHGRGAAQVVRWADGQVIWHSSETLAAAASAPGVPGIAIETYRPGRPEDQVTILRADGHSLPVARGRLAGP